MIFTKYFAASFLFLAILTSCSNEPEPVSSNPILKANIKGKVLDVDTDEPIYEATIFTIPSSTEAQTGIDGDFILNDIQPRDYVVYGHLQGFDEDSVFISLHNGDTANVNLYLNNFGEYLDYYPLDIGNYWEYWTVNNPVSSIEIISDTLINNITYHVSIFKSLPSGNLTETRFERIDSIKALVYRYFQLEEKIIDSLSAKQGERFTSNMFLEWGVCTSFCTNIEETNIFGEIRKLRYMSHDCGQDLPWYQILKEIGLYSYGWPRPPSGVTLRYAIIKGVEYGKR